MSKAYAMTGWRIGWTLSPANIAKAMADLQSQETSNPSSISQYAALAALEGPQECVQTMLAEFAKRREFVRERIAIDPGSVLPRNGRGVLRLHQHQAAPGPQSYAGTRVDNSTQWCLTLLEQQNVATVMGSAFGAEGYARISFATGPGDPASRLRPH